MKIKICIAFMLGLIVIGTLCGCGNASNGMESSFEEFDVDYTTNDNGTYTYEGNITNADCAGQSVVSYLYQLDTPEK